MWDHVRSPSARLVSLFVVGVFALGMFVTASIADTPIRGGYGLLSVETTPTVDSQVTVDGTPRNTSGVHGLELPTGSYEVCFDEVDGYLVPPCEWVTLADGQSISVTASFVPAGMLEVTTAPSGTGGMIVIDGVSRDRGAVTVPLPGGPHEVCFGDVGGYEAPACETVVVAEKGTVSLVGTYTAADPSGPGEGGFTPDPYTGSPDPGAGAPDPGDEGDLGGPGSPVDGGANEHDGATDQPRSGGFSDVTGGVHRDAILRMVEAGVITGYADGTFRPAGQMTRGQLASLLTRALDLDMTTCSGACMQLSDADGSVHAPAIRALVDSGIASGYADGTYRPEQHVTRGQLAGMLARALDVSVEGVEHPFLDVRGTTHEAEVAALHAAGVIHGTSATSYSPHGPVRRDQSATLLDRALSGH